MCDEEVAMAAKTPAHGCSHHGLRGHEIEHQHGDVQIRTLRCIYGSGFAAAFCDSYALRDVLAQLDRSSLDKLLVDFKRGELDAKIAAAALKELSSVSKPAAGLPADRL
jgi:hypothetical protein